MTRCVRFSFFCRVASLANATYHYCESPCACTCTHLCWFVHYNETARAAEAKCNCYRAGIRARSTFLYILVIFCAKFSSDNRSSDNRGSTVNTFVKGQHVHSKMLILDMISKKKTLPSSKKKHYHTLPSSTHSRDS